MHVFRRKLENSSISGLYLRHPTVGGCILINYIEDVYRQRFTLAHEAAHAYLDDEEDFVVSGTWLKQDLSEIRANNFASSFLMPPALLKLIVVPSGWNEDEVYRWADRLKVSVQSLSIALNEAGLVDETAAKELGAMKRSRHKTDPELPDSLSPFSLERKRHLLERGLSDYYVNLCFELYYNGLASKGKIAEMLLCNEKELGDLADLYKVDLNHAD